jgi:glycosyltransferase involved in cell wall biosynthesis
MTIIMSAIISIITICKNSEKTINKTLDSLVEELSDSCEYIIVDGESTDGTLVNILNHPISSYKNFRLLSREAMGVYDALNFAISNCNGLFTLIVHSNDMLLKNSISNYETAIHSNPEIDIFYADAIYEDTSCNTSTAIQSEKKPYLIRMRRMAIVHSTMLIKTSLLKNRQYSLDYTIASDYEMLNYYLKSGRTFMYLPMKSHHITDIGVSSKFLIKSTLEVFDINFNYNKFNIPILIVLLVDFSIGIVKISLKKLPILYCLTKKTFYSFLRKS